jgi:hypothetical protein
MFKNHKKAVKGLAFSFDGMLYSGGDDSMVR